MAQIILSETPGSAVSLNKTKKVATTATAVITPKFSSVDRISSPPTNPINFNISDLGAFGGTGSRNAIPGFLQGKRPKFGLLFPRGYYNK